MLCKVGKKSVNASIITSEGLLQKIFDFVAWLDDCVVFLDKQLSPHSASLHLRLKDVKKLLGKT